MLCASGSGNARWPTPDGPIEHVGNHLQPADSRASLADDPLMAKASSYPLASALTGDEKLLGTQNGRTVNVSPGQIGDYNAGFATVAGPYEGQVSQTLIQV